MRNAFVVGLALLAGSAPALPARAADAPIEVRWSAPPGCPDQAALVNAIAEQRGRMPALQVNAATLFDARLERAAQGYALDVRTRADGIPGRRILMGDDCVTLARVAAMIASVLMDQGAAQEPEKISASPSPSARLALRAQAVVDAGSLPAVALGPSLTAGLRLHATSLEIGASYLPTQAIDVAAAVAQPAAELQLLADRWACARRCSHRPSSGRACAASTGSSGGARSSSPTRAAGRRTGCSAGSARTSASSSRARCGWAPTSRPACACCAWNSSSVRSDRCTRCRSSWAGLGSASSGGRSRR
jgi:hypothetical protein